MDSNRYEEVPQKEGIFKKFFKYLKFVFIDFINSFKYNNMKLAGLLVLLPGALFGFFLGAHYQTLVHLAFLDVNGNPYNGMIDYSGFILFVMMLIGILNIFVGFSLMNKKNLGTVILTTISTVAMTVCAVLYVYLIITYKSATDTYLNEIEKLTASGMDFDAAKKYLVDTNFNAIPATDRFSFGSNEIMSLFAVGLCVVSSIAGVILGFIRYDRTYEKSKDRR